MFLQQKKCRSCFLAEIEPVLKKSHPARLFGKYYIYFKSLFKMYTTVFFLFKKLSPSSTISKRERKRSYHFFLKKYIDIFFLFSCTLVCLAVYMKSSIWHAATNMGVHQSLIISNIFSQIDTLIYLVGTNVHSILRQYLDICT